MKTTFRRSVSLLALSSLVTALAHAHPGHDGHESGGLTWDFSHLAAYPLATLGCVALLAALGWAAWSHLHSARDHAPQSLRKSDEQ